MRSQGGEEPSGFIMGCGVGETGNVPLRLREEPSKVDPTWRGSARLGLGGDPLEAPLQAKGEGDAPMGKTSLLSWAQQHLKLLWGIFFGAIYERQEGPGATQLHPACAQTWRLAVWGTLSCFSSLWEGLPASRTEPSPWVLVES